jgi:regulator of RNase E activity RraA
VIGGVQIHPGDLVVADDTGVCFIPREDIMKVLEAAEKKARSEAQRVQAIDSGLSVPDVLRSGE